MRTIIKGENGFGVAMRYRVLAFALVAVMIAVSCTQANSVPADELRATALNKAIMCPQCPGESIDQAQNQLSIDMRGIVRERISDGWTDGQIKDFFVDRYGPSVLLSPPTDGINLAAWVVPPVVLAIAVALLLMALRFMRRSPAARPEGPSGSVRVSADERSYYFRCIEEALGDAPNQAAAVEGEEPSSSKPKGDG